MPVFGPVLRKQVLLTVKCLLAQLAGVHDELLCHLKVGGDPTDQLYSF